MTCSRRSPSWSSPDRASPAAIFSNSAELDLGSGDGLPPDLLGLFVGASHLERCDENPIDGVARIHLFQRNLERACSDRAELIAELRITLYHELGHLLGFDEHGVDELGLG